MVRIIELFRLFDDWVAYATNRQPCFRDIPRVSNLFSCSLPPDFELWTPLTDVTSATTGVAHDAVAPTYQDIRLSRHDTYEAMLRPILAEADAARAPVPVTALADDEVSAAADDNSNPADSTLDPATLARARLILERILHELPPVKGGLGIYRISGIGGHKNCIISRLRALDFIYYRISPAAHNILLSRRKRLGLIKLDLTTSAGMENIALVLDDCPINEAAPESTNDY